MMTDDTQSLRGGALNQSSSPAGTQEPVAWVVFAENGNIRLWGKDCAGPQAFADEKGLTCEPVYRAAPASQDATREGPDDDWEERGAADELRKATIAECAKHIEQEADIATNSLHCGDNAQTIAAVHSVSRAYYEAAKSIRALASGADRAVTADERAIQDIAAERQRQISSEGWTSIHDDQHNTGEMARAAACYALSAGPEKVSDLSLIHKLWPWEWRWFKPRSKREDLVRAGALIAAEIERLDRICSFSPPDGQKP